MNETPEEQEQRQHLEPSKLKRQSRRVQRLAKRRLQAHVYAEVLEMLGDVETESELPQTTEARLAAITALREFTSALDAEISADWVEPTD